MAHIIICSFLAIESGKIIVESIASSLRAGISARQRDVRVRDPMPGAVAVLTDHVPNQPSSPPHPATLLLGALRLPSTMEVHGRQNGLAHYGSSFDDFEQAFDLTTSYPPRLEVLESVECHVTLRGSGHSSLLERDHEARYDQTHRVL